MVVVVQSVLGGGRAGRFIAIRCGPRVLEMDFHELIQFQPVLSVFKNAPKNIGKGLGLVGNCCYGCRYTRKGRFICFPILHKSKSFLPSLEYPQ